MKQIFRTICSVVAIMAMTVIAASCAKDELSKEAQQRIPGVERTISATATLPQDADKAHIDGSRKVIWDMGDELNINGTNVAISRIGPDGTTAKFDESTVHANTVSGTDHYWAVYPTTLAGAYSGGLPTEFTSTTSLTVHFPDTQVVNTADMSLSGRTYMAAHAAVTSGDEDVCFAMRNLGAVMKLILQPKAGNANNRVDSLVFSSSNASLAGTFSVSDDRNNPTITPTAGTNNLVVKFQDNGNKYIDITGGATVYVILPPLASKSLKVMIYGADAKYTEKEVATATLNRNNFYSSAISDIAFDKPFLGYGPFSVSATKHVYFSPGNLQWSATGGGATPTTHATADGLGAEGTWRFAEHQWNYVGDNYGGTVYGVGGDMSVKCNNSLTSQYYKGWIDLFGWGTSGWNSGAACYMPYSTSQDNSHYRPGGDYTNNLVGAYAYADWGVYNEIFNPQTNSTDPAGTWRTLTGDELSYLFNTRTSGTVNGTANARYTRAFINTDGTYDNGIILFPDGYTDNGSAPAGVTWGAINAPSDGGTQCTSAGWATLEAAGCVFLPAAGARVGTKAQNSNFVGGYYTSSHIESDSPFTHVLLYYLNHLGATSGVERHVCYSVRLVKDVH